jgi:hypothetical protein
LLKHSKVEHRYVAAVHLCQLGLTAGDAPRLLALDDADLRVAWCALGGLNLSEDEDVVDDEEGELHDSGKDLFASLERLYKRVPEKPTDTKPLVWPWTAMRLDRRFVTAQMLGALGDRPPTRLLPYLPAFHSYHRALIVGYLAAQKKWDRLTRDSLLDLAGDSGSEVRKAAYDALARQPLQRGEAERLESYLTRKTSDLRRGVIGLLAKQKDADALASADRLLTAKDFQQRLAGLELVRQLAEADRQRKGCQERAEAYGTSRKQLTKEEETQLGAIKESGRERLTLDNALGLMNPGERSPIVPPKKHKVPFITDAAIACLKELDELVHIHRETTVSYEDDGRRVEQLLGSFTYGFPWPEWQKPPDEGKTPLPLRDIWEGWRDRRSKALRDPDGLELIRAHIWGGLEEYEYKSWRQWSNRSREHREVGRTLSGDHDYVKLRYRSVVGRVLWWLIYLNAPKNAIDVLLDTLETAFALVPESLHHRLAELAIESSEDSDDNGPEPDWREQEPFDTWGNALSRILNLWSSRPGALEWTQYWNLLHWFDQPIVCARRRRPDLSVLKQAYTAFAATQADWYDQLLRPHYKDRYGDTSFDDLRWMTRITKENDAYFRRCPDIRALINRCAASASSMSS